MSLNVAKLIHIKKGRFYFVYDDADGTYITCFMSNGDFYFASSNFEHQIIDDMIYFTNHLCSNRLWCAHINDIHL